METTQSKPKRPTRVEIPVELEPYVRQRAKRFKRTIRAEVEDLLERALSAEQAEKDDQKAQ